ncbi:C-C motif chemokine 5-like [Macrotis lagotis]|uniref:C-C motif chemokine 5-like n=1 Tax=Macrotis lagotis TaxID=92651 RepID=UPI003D68BC65
MKVFAVVSIHFLLAILYSPASSIHASDTTPCCFFFTSPLPPQFYILDYYYTSSRCANVGVIFITKKKRQLCANPKKRWVLTYIDSLKRSVSSPKLPG